LKTIDYSIKKTKPKFNKTAIGMDLTLKKAGKISKRGPKDNFPPKPKGWPLCTTNFI
jgi:hypothetical protein